MSKQLNLLPKCLDEQLTPVVLLDIFSGLYVLVSGWGRRG